RAAAPASVPPSAMALAAHAAQADFMRAQPIILGTAGCFPCLRYTSPSAPCRRPRCLVLPLFPHPDMSIFSGDSRTAWVHAFITGIPYAQASGMTVTDAGQGHASL